MPDDGIDLGVYTLDRETKNTVRYAKANGEGRVETIYVMKEKLTEPWPQRIRLVIHPA